MKGGRVVDPVTGLTPNRELFATEVARTGKASEAYRKAYNAENMKPATINRRAFDLMADSRIKARIAALQAETRKQSGITLDEHMTALRGLRNAAAQSKQFGPAVTAEMARGKVSGLYDSGSDIEELPQITRVEIVIKDGRKPKEGGDA